MMNRVIKRMQRGMVQQQASQRPALTRGNKSYSDSTMETVTSDQNSIPSNSTRDTLQNNNSNHNSSSHHRSGGEEISEDDMTINSSHPDRKQDDDTSSTHHRKMNPPMPTVKTNSNITKRKTAVCFASDYGSPPEIIESNMVLSEEELLDCFYTTTELNSFDRDRALTVLMYQTRNKSVPWDDNEHSLRGLEEHASASGTSDGLDMNTNKSSSSRRTTRKDLIQSVLNEQTRLRDTVEGRKEVMQASKVSGMTPEELIRELLRGVSFSLSKYDRQRAIQLAQKDEREVNAYNPRWKDQLMSTNQYYNNITSTIMTQFTPNSRRKYLSMVKSRINDWSNTSNKSISSTGTCGDRSTTSSTNGNHGNEHPPQPQNTVTSLQSRSGPRRRTRKHVLRNNSIDDSVSDNNGNCGDESDDNIDDDDFYTVLQPQRQDAIIFNKASPLSIIQQVVYETSKEFDYDHTTNR